MLDAVIVSDLHLGAANSRHREVERLLWRHGPLYHAHRVQRRHRGSLELTALAARTYRDARQPTPAERSSVEIVWITGNHEANSAKANAVLDLPFVDEYRFYSAGVPVLCQHGHQYDDFILTHPILTWMGDIVYGLAQAIDPSHRLAR